MFNTMKMYHKKFISLSNLTPRTKSKEKLKQEVLKNAGDIYNKLYYIYKNKYNKKINSLNAKNRIKLDHKKLRLTDDYRHPSEEEWEEKTITDANTFNEQINKEEKTISDANAFKEQINKEEKTITDANPFNEQIDREETDINTELFKNIFIFKDLVIC